MESTICNMNRLKMGRIMTDNTAGHRDDIACERMSDMIEVRVQVLSMCQRGPCLVQQLFKVSLELWNSKCIITS